MIKLGLLQPQPCMFTKTQCLTTGYLKKGCPVQITCVVAVWQHEHCETQAELLQQSIVAVFNLGDCLQAHKAVERAAGAVSDTGALGQPARQSLQARQRALQQLQAGSQLPGVSCRRAGHPGTCDQRNQCHHAPARIHGHSCFEGSPVGSSAPGGYFRRCCQLGCLGSCQDEARQLRHLNAGLPAARPAQEATTPPADGEHDEAEAEEELPALMSRIKAAQPPQEVLKVNLASHCSLLWHGLRIGNMHKETLGAAPLEVAQGGPGIPRSWLPAFKVHLKAMQTVQEVQAVGSQNTDSVPVRVYGCETLLPDSAFMSRSQPSPPSLHPPSLSAFH